MNNRPWCHLCRLGGLIFAFLLPASAIAQNKGMVVREGGVVEIFDSDANTIIRTLNLPGGFSTTGDCSITPDARKGFVTDFASRVHVIDLTTNTFAGGPNPIAIGNPGENTSLTTDGKFLVVCDGGGANPVVSVNTATQTVASTLALGQDDCNGVAVCDNNSVLVTSSRFSVNPNTVHRLTINPSTGALTNTGETLAAGSSTVNVWCAPGSKTGIVRTRFQPSSLAISFTVPGLAALATVMPAGQDGVGVNTNAKGDTMFTTGFGSLQAWPYNSATGAIGAATFNTFILNQTPYFGMHQMAIHPNQTLIYVSQSPASLDRYSTTTGALVGSMALGGGGNPTGVCFPPAGCHAPPDVVTHGVNVFAEDKAFEQGTEEKLEVCGGDPVVLPFHLSDCVTSVTSKCFGVLDINQVGKVTRIEAWAQAEQEDLAGKDAAHKIAEAIEQTQHRIDDEGCAKYGFSGTTAQLPYEGLSDPIDRYTYYLVYFDVIDAGGNMTHSVCRANMLGKAKEYAKLLTKAAEEQPVPVGCAVCVGTGCGSCAMPGEIAAGTDKDKDDVVCGHSLSECAEEQAQCARHPHECKEYDRKCTTVCM